MNAHTDEAVSTQANFSPDPEVDAIINRLLDHMVKSVRTNRTRIAVALGPLAVIGATAKQFSDALSGDPLHALAIAAAGALATAMMAAATVVVAGAAALIKRLSTWDRK